MKRVLVTGASGFIGRHLVRRMRSAGTHDVVVVPKGLDLRDRDAARRTLAGAGKLQYVVHAADVGGDAEWAASHAGTQLLANSLMALHMLEAWREFQPQARFVGLGSLWAYPEEIVEIGEEAYWSGRMHQPTEHYGLGKKLLVWGDGTEIRDFVYIDDQIAGILRHLDYDGELLNVTTGVYHSIRELVSALVRVMDYRGEIVYSAVKGLGVASRRMSVMKAASVTGWPGDYRLHALEEGLRMTVEATEESDDTWPKRL